MSMEPESSNREELGDCHVCDQPAHGVHFGLLTCRACAAFFRRTVVCNRQYPCRNGLDRCLIQKETRQICRKCRYNKCLRLGMTADNVQWNRDLIGSLRKSNSAKSPVRESEPEREPEELPRPIPRLPGEKPAWFGSLDDAILCEVFEKLEHLFATYNPEQEYPGIWEQSPLARMQIALQRHRQNQIRSPEHLILVQEISAAFLRGSWTYITLRVAEWHMFCKEFAMLPLKEKITIFRESWKWFLRLERIGMSLEIFGDRVLTDRIFVVGDTVAMKYDEIRIDMSSMSEYDDHHLRKFFGPLMEVLETRVIKPMMSLDLTSFEFIYMLTQLCFHVEGMELSNATMDSLIAFRDNISDDIHNYYMATRQPNYAQRLIKIMSLIQSVENVQTQRKQMMELIRIFDVIKIESEKFENSDSNHFHMTPY